MTFSLGKLRFGRSSASSTSSSTPSSPATPVADNIASPSGDALRASSTQRTPTPTITSPRTRFGSWLARVRTRKDSTGASAADTSVSGGRPATPTPHLLLASGSSASSRDARMKTLRRVRVQATGQSKEVLDVHDNDDDDDEESVVRDEDDAEEERRGEEDMSEAERDRLASFASGLRGLIAQLQLADEESRSMPPMKNAEGTPLSPITEADELDDDDLFELNSSSASEPSTCSVGAVTDLDYGEPLDVLTDSSDGVDVDVTPRWYPEEEEEITGSATPVFVRRLELGDAKVCFGGQLEDEVVERELGLHDEIGEETETGTEDEQEYFSAASPPVSSGEEEDGSENPDATDFGLHLRGLDLARSVSTIDIDGESTATDEELNVFVNDVGLSREETPRALAREHLPSQPSSSPRKPLLPAKRMRQRAVTLPGTSGSGKVRALPPLPPLVIPAGAADNVGMKAETETEVEERDVGQLVHAVARLQREKARLEQALVCANLKIGQQDSQLVSLTKQIASLRATLMRLACAGPGLDADESNASSEFIPIPIIVRAPSNLEDEEPEEEEIQAGISTESVNPLSTPPATPDRRAASALVDGGEGGEKAEEEASASLLGTPKAGAGGGRGLVRRKSAGAASALSSLGVGRAQVKRRAGSADLKTLTTSMPWS